MQELISRAKELLADNTVARVLKHRKAWMNSFTMAFAEQI